MDVTTIPLLFLMLFHIVNGDIAWEKRRSGERLRKVVFIPIHSILFLLCLARLKFTFQSVLILTAASFAFYLLGIVFGWMMESFRPASR